MALSNTQVLDRLKKPLRKQQLTKATQHEQRLSFHAEECLTSNDCSPYLSDFLKWVKDLLPSDKYRFFQQMMAFPIYTTELSEAIMDELNKVFSSNNSSFTYEFTSDQQESEFQNYLSRINFWSRWVEEAQEGIRSKINSIVVVDLPETAEGEETKPYFYFLSINAVRDIDLGEGDEIKALIFEEEDRVILIDDERYAVFKKNAQTSEYSFYSESFHELSYCPACFFWRDPIKRKYPIVKSSPFTPALNNLDYLVFAETARRCLESYAAFPITVSFAADCTYYEEVDGRRYDCNDGYLMLPDSKPVACPVCEKNKLIGPGTHMQIDPPSSKDEPNNLEMVKQIPAEVQSLDYWTKRTAELWDEIFYDVVGSGGDTMTQAINKDQVRGNFESKQNVLMKLKKNLERSNQFVVETIARLIYGPSFIKASINYGTQFYLRTASEAQKEFKEAKDSAVPVYLLSYKRQQVDSANTKGNPSDQQRLQILEQLEPWVDLSLKEAKDAGLDTIDKQAYLLKADFSSRVMRFESEYGSVVAFGSKLDFNTKIERIKSVLIQYNNQSSN